MANKLPIEKKIAIVSALCEGTSIRAIERMTGVHRDSIMRLGVRMGEGCKRIMDEKLRNLTSNVIEVDEVWGFVGMKQKTANRAGAGEGGPATRPLETNGNPPFALNRSRMSFPRCTASIPPTYSSHAPRKARIQIRTLPKL